MPIVRRLTVGLAAPAVKSSNARSVTWMMWRAMMSAEAHARVENGKMSRFQELMRQRREAAKTAGN